MPISAPVWSGDTRRRAAPIPLPAMTTFLLIRHASHDLLGKTLVGRGGVHLNARGKMEAERLAARLGGEAIRALYTSPRERAQETAWPLAERLLLSARVSTALDEIDFGEWTGKTFDELHGDARFHRWNAARATSEAPGGETMLAAQHRIVAEIERLSEVHPGETVALVSHGDILKSALMHFLGIPLDFILRLEISPASVSTLVVQPGHTRVTGINDLGGGAP